MSTRLARRDERKAAMLTSKRSLDKSGLLRGMTQSLIWDRDLRLVEMESVGVSKLTRGRKSRLGLIVDEFEDRVDGGEVCEESE